MDDREKLYQAAKALCDDFAARKDVETLTAHFSTTCDCRAIEHGEQVLAPFLGRTYKHLAGIEAYFTQLSELISYSGMEFYGWIVDSQ